MGSQGFLRGKSRRVDKPSSWLADSQQLHALISLIIGDVALYQGKRRLSSPRSARPSLGSVRSGTPGSAQRLGHHGFGNGHAMLCLLAMLKIAILILRSILSLHSKIWYYHFRRACVILRTRGSYGYEKSAPHRVRYRLSHLVSN